MPEQCNAVLLLFTTLAMLTEAEFETGAELLQKTANSVVYILHVYMHRGAIQFCGRFASIAQQTI